MVKLLRIVNGWELSKIVTKSDYTKVFRMLVKNGVNLNLNNCRSAKAHVFSVNFVKTLFAEHIPVTTFDTRNSGALLQHYSFL